MENIRNNIFESYNTKRITYVMSTKNRADKLGQALSSCREFKRFEDELIVIDGSSTDNTENVVKEFSDIIDIYISEPDKNDKEAFNKGFLLASGEYIKILNDDDMFYGDALDKVCNIMDSHPEIDLIIPGGIRTRDGKWNGDYIYLPPGTNYGSSIDDIYKNGWSVNCCGMLFRRKLLSKVGLWEVDSVSNDHCFLIRSIYLKANVKFCRINMYLHDLNADCVTMKDHKLKYAEVDRIIRTYSSKKFQKKYFRPMLILERYIKRHIYPDSFPALFYQKNSIIYRLIRKMIRLLNKLYRILVKKQDTNDRIEFEYIWDGGFS